MVEKKKRMGSNPLEFIRDTREEGKNVQESSHPNQTNSVDEEKQSSPTDKKKEEKVNKTNTPKKISSKKKPYQKAKVNPWNETEQQSTVTGQTNDSPAKDDSTKAEKEDAFNSQQEDLAKTVDTISAELKKKDQQIKDLESQAASQKKMVLDLETKLKEKEQTLGNKEKELENLAELFAKNEELEKKYKSTSAELLETKRLKDEEIKTLKEQLEGRNEIISSLEGEEKEKIEPVAELFAKNEELQKKYKNTAAELLKVRGEFEQLKSDYDTKNQQQQTGKADQNLDKSEKKVKEKSVTSSALKAVSSAPRKAAAGVKTIGSGIGGWLFTSYEVVKKPSNTEQKS
ncbi:MAG: hypothetical protein HQM13_21880 [SAR324 cluster bacterium]|nr:hypothetical protein [SAR324 cluster bacterium]